MLGLGRLRRVGHLDGSWCIMVDANPGNWEPRVDERRYMAVRGGQGQKEIVEEFWGLVEGRFEVGI